MSSTTPTVWWDRAPDIGGDPSSAPGSSRPVVVMIHGSMDRSAGMLRVGRRLDATCTVVRYDRRGYARSAPHPGPFAMADQLADLVDVLDAAAGDRRAVLVGHSYGGNVALACAARHPERVAGVVVYETPLSWEPWWPGSTAGAAAVAIADDPEGAAERFMRRMIGDRRWEGLPEGTRRTRRSEGVAMVAELADLRRHRPWEAAAIRVPVVAGYGDGGAPHHRDAMRHVAATIDDCEVVELAGCRHDAPLSDPAQFAERLVVPLLGRLGSL